MAEGIPEELPKEAHQTILGGTLYAVTAVLSNGRQLPTFYLDSSVQGITGTGHATDIARLILGWDPDITVCKL